MAFVVSTAICGSRRGLSLLSASGLDYCLRNRSTSVLPEHKRQITNRSTKMTDGVLINKVIEHWCGSLSIPRYSTLEQQNKLWYAATKEIDDDIRNRFGADVESALEGKLDHLMGSETYPIRGDLALVILLDQYPRNIYRGTARAFAGDSKCRDVVMNMLKPDRWSAAKEVLPAGIQASFLLPLMHQESVADVELCATQVDDLIKDCRNAGEEGIACAKTLEQMRAFAEKHKDILARFGRYPYRNAVLGRECTKAEQEFLEDCPRFGQ